MNQAQADLRGHDGNAADLVFHHAFSCFASSARVVVGIAQNGVVSQLSSSNFETLDDLREERVLNVGDNDSEGAPVVRSQMARMNVADISQLSDSREHKTPRLPAHLACLVQDIGDGCGGNLG